MASVTENLARVKSEMASIDSRRTEIDHARILDEHEEAIREHERQMRSQRDILRSHGRKRRKLRDGHSPRFRFKSGRDDVKEQRRPDDSHNVDRFTAHPLGRPSPEHDLDPSDQPQTADSETADPDTAFKTSLFDALADDEGAAYWEAVYNQPIHIYPRKAAGSGAEPAPQGQGLESMTDDEYAAYVKQKMWERAHPMEARDLRRRRETRVPRAEAHRDPDTHRVRAEMDAALERGRRRKRDKTLAAAWARYLAGWDVLMATPTETPTLIWPVTTRQHVMPDLSDPDTIADVRALMLDAPLAHDETRIARLKAERFKWHPDKMVHRFGRALARPQLGAVTALFQIVDELIADERRPS